MDGGDVAGDGWEHEFRRRRFAQIAAAYERSGRDRVDHDAVARQRAIERPKVIAFLDAFKAGGDLEELRRSLDSWSKTTGTHFGFKGPNGQMYLNQLAKDGQAFGVEAQLGQWLRPPASDHQAALAIDELAIMTADLRRQGSAAQVARAPFLLSWMWWIQEPTRWLPIWPSRESPLVQLGFAKAGYAADKQGQRYLEYLRVCRDLGPDAVTERVLLWYSNNPSDIGLDSTACERCELALQLPREPGGGGSGYQSNLQNVGVVLADLRRIGTALAGAVSASLACPVRSGTPGLFWAPEARRIRGDGWVSWQPEAGIFRPPICSS